MAGIGVARPDDTPHATEYVDEMVAMIGQLVEIGRAYPTDDGVYLSVRRSRTTACSPTSRSTTCSPAAASATSFGAEQKRHPADFVLWKLAKPGEPSWPSPWGDGRPGWHSECVVMSLDLLGEGFDLHCGGLDLRFPHHENERAQAVALGKRFANHWMHHAFVVDAEGEKMSKSLGNVDNLLDLLDQLRRADVPDAAAAEPLPQPGARRRRHLQARRAGARRPRRVRRPQRRRSPPRTRTPACSTAFRGAMDDDLDTPAAMARPVRHRAAGQRGPRRGRRRGRRARRRGARDRRRRRPRARRRRRGAGRRAERAAALDAARAAKDYATADAIRAELQAAGWIVETTAAGTAVRR